MANGYNGKILRVNLTSGAITTEKLEEMFCRRYIGGAGFITYYLMKELAPGIDALGIANKLMFMMGPMTGLTLSGSGRNCVGCKSPLTGGLAKAEVGGFWGAEVRRAGFDGIIVEGKSAKPVYLWIKDGEVQLKEAGHLWGKPTKETEAMIRAELGDTRIRVASIGPGGENLVRYACVMNDLKEAAGRGGTGAVMGSKNLKAIAARGNKTPEIAHPESLGEYRQSLMDNKERWLDSSLYGTGSAMENYIKIGNTPVNNFRDGEFPEIGQISARALKDTIRIGMEGCYACVVRCKKVVKVDEPDMKIDPLYGGAEYETLAAFGNNCGVSDLKAISKAHEMCNAYALDTISAGLSISLAMECYEQGLLTNKDTGGIDLKWGNAKSMLKVLELIARREGIGDLLAEGSKIAGEKIGRGAEKFSIQVKGLEFGMHDPRAKAALGLGYAVNPHGADHCLNFQDVNYTSMNPSVTDLASLGILEPLPADDLSPKKVQMFHFVHNSRLLLDSYVMCSRPPYTNSQYVEMLKNVTGWDTGPVELMRIADRILTLARMFNLREGFTAKDDILPDRFFEGRHGGPAAAKKQDRQKLQRAINYYYRIMGWDEKGVPVPETLEALDIGWAGGK
jgi:aldehyde:ferredoxin oxidoreductase